MCLASSIWKTWEINDETLAIYWWVSSFKSPELYALSLAKVFAANKNEEHKRKFWKPLEEKIINYIIEWKKFSILNKSHKYCSLENYDLPSNLYRRNLEWELQNTDKNPLPLVNLSNDISKKILDLVKKSV